MELPIQFCEKFKKLLADEYDEFEKTLIDQRSYGLRINPIKTDSMTKEDFDNMLEHFASGNIPWCKTGYFYEQESRPGKSIYHEAGAYYIQEPSAMSVVEILDPKPGERICDLCAAPGGKTTHIAGKMCNLGTLVSNEIVPDRARILAKNVERMGISNCIVLNEDPHVLESRFSGFFHKIVVDAPCSGEGMFRKEEAAITEWSDENVNLCSDRQKWILDCAAEMVMPGGVLVYSTCTFEPSEDEDIIGQFLEKHGEWEIVETGLENYFSPGRPDWMQNPNEELTKANRIWPHKNKGEGHFIAKLRKKGEIPLISNVESTTRLKANKQKAVKTHSNDISNDEAFRQISNAFIDRNNKELETILADRKTVRFGDTLYLLPKDIDERKIKGLRIARAGLELAEIKKNRIEPAHALAMCLKPDFVIHSIAVSHEEAVKYMRGETLNVDTDMTSNGQFVLLTIDGISIGYGKNVNGIIKNHYPKGLRRDNE